MPKKSAATKRTDYQPPDGSVAFLNLRAAFLERIAEIAPEIIDDLFKQLFDVLIRHSNFSPEVDEIDLLVWRPPAEMLLGSADSTSIQDKSRRAWFLVQIRQAVMSWAKPHGIDADWCFDFCFRSLSRYWTRLKKARGASTTSELMVFVTEFLQGEHREAWRVEAEKIRRSIENQRHFLHLFDSKDLAKMAEHGNPISTKAKQPIPPKQFPSRIKGMRILTREEYERAAKNALAFEVYEWQAGGLSEKASRSIGAAIFEARKEQFDAYNNAFDSFLRKCGWVEASHKRELEKHLDWVIYWRCKSLNDQQIHEIHAPTVSPASIAVEIRDTEKALGFKSLKRRGGSRPGPRKREKIDPAPPVGAQTPEGQSG